MSSRKLLTYFVIFILMYPSTALTQTLTLAADEWPPFNSTPGSDEEGFIVDVARAVFEKEGIDIKYIILPWKRAVAMVKR